MNKRSLWSVLQIACASYIAGPIGGCYFMGRNYKELGLPNHAKRCYLIGFISTILLTVILFVFPEDLIPYKFLPIASSSLILYLAQVLQKTRIKEKIAQGSRRHSYFWCFLVTLSILVIQLSVFFIFWFLI